MNKDQGEILRGKHAVYQAVYIETFNRLVARSIEKNLHLWNVSPHYRPRNGGTYMSGNNSSSRKKELNAIVKIAEETALAASQTSNPYVMSTYWSHKICEGKPL